MGLFYSVYVLIVAAWVFYDAPTFERSRWWALGVFAVPFITPIYFVKTRPAGKYWKLVGLWLAGFFVFHTIGTAWIMNHS